MSWWWLTFTDSPGGKLRELGVAIVQGTSMESAVAEASARKLHPGGEPTGYEIPEGVEQIPEGWCNRLLNPQNAKAVVSWTGRAWGKR